MVTHGILSLIKTEHCEGEQGVLAKFGKGSLQSEMAFHCQPITVGNIKKMIFY